MENKDEYIVQKCRGGKGSLFFFKNGKLHREAGPAIVTVSNKKYFTNLGDENLYKEEIVQSDFPKNYSPDSIDEFEYVNGRSVLIHSIAKYYLEGQPYDLEQFEDIKHKFILKTELSQDLPISDNISKKVKI